MRHHFQDHRYGFGVSSPLWDAVFRTLPKTRRTSLTVTLNRTDYGPTVYAGGRKGNVECHR